MARKAVYNSLYMMDSGGKEWHDGYRNGRKAMEVRAAMDTEKKLEVLSRVGDALNRRGVVWAVGASLLLYLKGIVPTFQDIDILVAEADVEQAREALLPLGTQHPENPNAQYKTKHFLEFTIDGVDLDVMAGFVIVHEGREYAFPLEESGVAEYTLVNGVSIPLQPVEAWRTYYALMGRAEKVALIERRNA